MGIHIEFFQATATVVPTLLIALAVGLKGGQQFADRFKSDTEGKKKVARYGHLFMVLLLATLIAISEFTSLVVLVSDRFSSLQALVSLSGVLFCLVILTKEFLQPTLNLLSDRERNFIEWLFVAGIVAALVSFNSAVIQ